MKPHAWVAVGGLMLSATMSCLAGSVAVVAANSSANKLTPEEVSSLYAMRLKSLPGASAAQLIVVDTSKAQLFTLMGKSESQARAIWSRMVFTGGGTPPQEVGTAAEARKLLKDPNALAVIDASEVDASMKVVCAF